MSFDFDGALDDVPSKAAVAVAGVARVLLRHADEHTGGRATMRVTRLGSLLNLWLADPECSPECLGRASHLPCIPVHDAAGQGEVRLRLDADPDGGLRLHWMLLLAHTNGPSSQPHAAKNHRRWTPARTRGSA